MNVELNTHNLDSEPSEAARIATARLLFSYHAKVGVRANDRSTALSLATKNTKNRLAELVGQPK